MKTHISTLVYLNIWPYNYKKKLKSVSGLENYVVQNGLKAV